MAALSEHLAKAGKEIAARSLYRALNHEGDKLRTQIRRLVSNQSGLSYAYVSAHFSEKRAYTGHLEYRVIARDAPKRLSEFAKGMVAGQKGVTASAWRKTRFFKQAFVVSLGGKLEVVKRVIKSHPKGSRLGVKVMYGPSIPVEHLRKDDSSFREYVVSMPQKFIPRVKHEIKEAFRVAGAK